MTQPIIRVGQIWERRRTGQQIRVTAITATNLIEVDHGDGRPRTHPMACTLHRNYQLITTPPIQDQP